MKDSYTIAELAAQVDGEVVGNSAMPIINFNDLANAASSEIAFVENEKFFENAAQSSAGCLIVGQNAEINFDGNRIVVKNPKLAFAKIAAALRPPKKRSAEIHKFAVVAETAEIGADVSLGAFVCVGENSQIGESSEIHAGAKIGDDVKIGQNCIIHSNCFLSDGVTIGNNVILHVGVVIGADGFGFVRDGANGYVKFPQSGTVIIDDDVEIGANSCIDRAALNGVTHIGSGTKIDNLVQIAHNVEIGERVVIASQTGISGSTIIESDAVIGGQVGMGDHARVQSGAIIGSKAGVLPGKIVRPGVWWGIPVQPLDEYKRQNAHVKSLPRLREEIKKLREEIARFETNLSAQNNQK